MKAMKKLIPTLCLLLISAVLMGTSTYAWFSMNTNVTATGMTVQAAVPKSLSISNASGGTYGTSASAEKNTSVVKLAPASTADVTNWFAPETTAGGISASEGTYDSTTTFQSLTADADTGLIKAATGDTVYGRFDKFYVKANASAETTGLYGLYVKDITLSATPSAITSALRIAVKYNTTVFYFTVNNPNALNAETLNPIASLDTAKKPQLADSALTIQAKGESAALIPQATELRADTEYEVTVYIWYDGQDSACTTSNAVNVQEVTVSIEFGCWDAAPTTPAGT